MPGWLSPGVWPGRRDKPLAPKCPGGRRGVRSGHSLAGCRAQTVGPVAAACLGFPIPRAQGFPSFWPSSPKQEIRQETWGSPGERRRARAALAVGERGRCVRGLGSGSSSGPHAAAVSRVPVCGRRWHVRDNTQRSPAVPRHNAAAWENRGERPGRSPPVPGSASPSPSPSFSQGDGCPGCQKALSRALVTLPARPAPLDMLLGVPGLTCRQ